MKQTTKESVTPKKILKPTQPKKRQGQIRVLQGETNELVVAPHGVYGDDDYTNVIAEELRKGLRCYALINERYRKAPQDYPDRAKDLLDLNIIEHAELVHGNRYLACFEAFVTQILETGGTPLILLIHGIDNGNIEEAAKKLKPSRIEQPVPVPDILIGYGQREDPALNRPTAKKETIDALIKNLMDEGTQFDAFFVSLNKHPIHKTVGLTIRIEESCSRKKCEAAAGECLAGEKGL